MCWANWRRAYGRTSLQEPRPKSKRTHQLLSHWSSFTYWLSQRPFVVLVLFTSVLTYLNEQSIWTEEGTEPQGFYLFKVPPLKLLGWQFTELPEGHGEVRLGVLHHLGKQTQGRLGIQKPSATTTLWKRTSDRLIGRCYLPWEGRQ